MQDLKNKAINTPKAKESAEVPSSSTEGIASCSSSSCKEDEPKKCTKTADSTTDEPIKSSESLQDSNIDSEQNTNENENAKPDTIENRNEKANADDQADTDVEANTGVEADTGVEVDADVQVDADANTKETVEKSSDEAACGGGSGSASSGKSDAEARCSDDQKVDSVDSTIKLGCIEENSAGDDTLIDIEDPDDYLLYLETILVKIHSRFYTHYDETKQVKQFPCTFLNGKEFHLLKKNSIFRRYLI